MVISTGTTLPRWDSVAALYCLQNSMMLTPCGPSAVPTGGAGVAWPAWSCTLTTAATFFFGGMQNPFVPICRWFRLPVIRATRRLGHIRRVGTAAMSAPVRRCGRGGRPGTRGPGNPGRGPRTGTRPGYVPARVSRPGLEDSRSDLGDLVEGQLDGRLPTEDRDQDLELLLLGVDLVDGGGEGGE